GAQPRRGPDVLHGDAGGAALELELEERLGAAAVDDLDPGVGGGRDELDDFDDGVGFAAVALEVDAVAVAFALPGGPRDGGGAVGEPLGHAARVGEELEHLFDGDADEAGVGEGHRTHGVESTSAVRSCAVRRARLPPTHDAFTCCVPATGRNRVRRTADVV